MFLFYDARDMRNLLAKEDNLTVVFISALPWHKVSIGGGGTSLNKQWMSVFQVAAVYVGTVIGAGFATARKFMNSLRNTDFTDSRNHFSWIYIYQVGH